MIGIILCGLFAVLIICVLAYEFGDKITEKKRKAEMQKIQEEFKENVEAATNQYYIESAIETATYKARRWERNVSGNICLVACLLSFVVGGYLCFYSVQGQAKSLEAEVEELEEEIADVKEEAADLFVTILEDVSEQLAFTEEIYGPGSVEEALRSGELSYSELVEMYKMATTEIMELKEYVFELWRALMK